MTMGLKTLGFAALLVLAGCGQNALIGNRLGDNAIGPNGSVSDPTSVAYFNATIGDRILFDIDQSTLNAASTTILDQQAEFLISNAGYDALIEGHADEQGTRIYNVALGARRASAVRDYLAGKGVPDSRLKTVSYGKERPVEICSAESCYRQNRRAVTVLTTDSSS